MLMPPTAQNQLFFIIIFSLSSFQTLSAGNCSMKSHINFILIFPFHHRARLLHESVESGNFQFCNCWRREQTISDLRQLETQTLNYAIFSLNSMSELNENSQRDFRRFYFFHISNDLFFFNCRSFFSSPRLSASKENKKAKIAFFHL